MPKLMPNHDDIIFKQKFIDRYSTLTDFNKFKEYSLSFLRRSIRVNTLKTTVSEIKKRLKDWNLKPIPWCEEGFWIEHTSGRRDIGNTIEHSLGYIYTQEAASMLPPLVLDPQPGEIILDMCASPGSKSTQIAQYMKNSGLLIANDYKGIRLAPLAINLQRSGVENSLITLMQGQWFKDFQFDRILVDAPCSGTGTIRKSLKTLTIWNPDMVRRLAITQRSLLRTAFENLKPKGTLVYSTCSCEPDENEGVISSLLDHYSDAKLQNINLNLKSSDPFTSFEDKKYNEEVKKCLRIWPQDNDTEGFFIAKIKKL